MKNAFFFFALSLVVAATNCSKSGDENSATCGNTTEFALNEPFYLCYGTEAHFNNEAQFTLRFDSLFGDSRCVLDSLALCAWEGRADAGLRLDIFDFTRLDTFSAAGLSNAAVFDSTEFSGYKIKLLAIEPYPTAANSPIPKEDYKIKLLVTQ